MAGTNVTPGRITRVTFDLAETITVSPFWGMRRRGSEIAQNFSNGEVDDAKHQNIKIWPTGAITLAPIQTEISNIQEYSIGLTHVVVPDNATLLTKLMVIPSIVVENKTRQSTDLTGLAGAYGGDIALVGSPFLVRKIPAGGSWDESITSGVPSMLSGTGSTPPPVPVDRVGESLAPYPADQGFFLNWQNPATSLTYPGVYLGFYFGQYAVAFTGSGYAILYEQVQSPSGNFDWVHRAVWQYARTGQISGTAHSMAIWPHFGPTGQKYIVFTNGQVDYAQVASSYAGTTATQSAPGYMVYAAKVDPRYIDRSPGHITSSALMRFDIRRDWKMPLQVSTLGWPTSGLLIDDPAGCPPDATSLNAALFPLRIFSDQVTLPTNSLTATVIDSVSGAPYDPTLGTHPAARFDFAGDGMSTPILWGYNMNRDSAQNVSAPGEFTSSVNSVNLTGYCGDPSQESATLMIEDDKGRLTRLLNRGQLSCRVDVQHVENGQTYITPIFRGYAMRPTGRKRGKPGRVYPSPNWFRYDIPVMGMWMRLAEPTSGPLIQNLFYNDITVLPYTYGGSQFTPWKVTDAIRYLLSCAGFSPGQINIPDYPIRLWPGVTNTIDNQTINPNTDYAEFALRLCRNFLGGYLCYDASVDQWTLLQGTSLNAPPLYSFWTTPPNTNGPPTVPGAYGPRSTFIFGEFSLTVVPPEYNWLHVTCLAALSDNDKTMTVIENWAFNYNSYQVPGSSVSPNPNNPDYLGRIRPCEISDPSLVVNAGADTERLTQVAVDWTVRRLYDFCGHAQRLCHFRAPLVFILDPITGVYRIPRFGDPILINGASYILKACIPSYTWDGMQTADYEAIQPVAGQYIPPGIESLEFFRKSTDRRGAKTAGSYTQTNRLGLLGIPPQAEHRHRNLPRASKWQHPLQDPTTGLFYAMAGYDGAGVGQAP
jgi:hypothetical protein